jgi:hypothetical protein
MKNEYLDQKNEYLDKKNEYLNKKNEYLDKKNEYLNKKKEYLDQKKEYLDKKNEYLWPLKWPSLSLVPFKEPKKSWAPQKVKILCRDHLESLNWPHLVIWQGRIHNTTLHLQHRCINS